MFNADLLFQRNQFQLQAEIQLHKASISVLLGESGAGKSTLFRLISGLEKPQQGRIQSGETIWVDTHNNICLATQKRKVGMMFQDYALFEHMSVYDNIAYGIAAAEQKTVVETWLKRIKLAEKANAYPCALSGGEKQRVALARALACKPDILLLDEPFSALDTSIRHKLRRELQTIIRQTKVPVLIATHDLDEARLIADYVYVMANGKIVRHGVANQVFKHPKNQLAATSLGWHNVLPVTQIKGQLLSGNWGELTLPHVPEPNIRAIGIPEKAIRLIHPGQGMQVTVTHAVIMANYHLIEVSMKDGTALLIQLENLQHLPGVGQVLDIQIDEQQIEPLT